MDFRRLNPWILAASLIVNGFLAGYVLSHHPGGPPPREPPRPGNLIEQMASRLPPEDARILMQAARDQRLLEGPPEEFKAFRQKSSELMAAEKFDAAAFRALTEEFSAKLHKNGDRVGSTLLQALPQMSLEGRRALAQFEKSGPPGGPPDGPPGPPGPRNGPEFPGAPGQPPRR